MNAAPSVEGSLRKKFGLRAGAVGLRAGAVGLRAGAVGLRPRPTLSDEAAEGGAHDVLLVVAR